MPSHQGEALVAFNETIVTQAESRPYTGDGPAHSRGGPNCSVAKVPDSLSITPRCARCLASDIRKTGVSLDETRRVLRQRKDSAHVDYVKYTHTKLFIILSPNRRHWLSGAFLFDDFLRHLPLPKPERADSP